MTDAQVLLFTGVKRRPKNSKATANLRRTHRTLQATIDEEGCGAVFAAARFTTGDDNEKDQ